MKYILNCSEVVHYALEVEANSEEEAREKLFNGEIQFSYDDITEGYDFDCFNIEEVK
jgi:hypothetical protein